jgi:hypothetical protein
MGMGKCYLPWRTFSWMGTRRGNLSRTPWEILSHQMESTCLDHLSEHASLSLPVLGPTVCSQVHGSKSPPSRNTVRSLGILHSVECSDQDMSQIG